VIEKRFVKSRGKSVVRVTFSLPSSTWACQVNLVGDFNSWNRTSHPLQQDKDGKWTITLDLEPGRTYEFRYLADGTEWANDNQADGTVPNPYGASNSLVVTPPEPETTPEKRPSK
jgi:1,4-alpha-glucan branching enzyme